MTTPAAHPSQRARAVLRAWRNIAGPWAPYVWPTLLTAPRPDDVPHDDDIAGVASAWVAEFHTALAADAGPTGHAWRSGAALAIADLPALVALASAPRLATRGIRPVAVLRRWPSPDALLPPAPVVDAYHRYAPLLRLRGRPRGAVFLVEAERCTAVPSALWEPAPLLRTRLDNRYTLDTQDLPAAERLRRGGVTTVLALAAPDAPRPSPDLLDYYRRLAAQGFTVATLRLATLAAVDASRPAEAAAP